MMTFFLSNTIESQLLASGAFEIFFNGKALCLPQTHTLSPH